MNPPAPFTPPLHSNRIANAPETRLGTEEADQVPEADMAIRDHPRPDFQRTDLRWHSLDGPWDFYFDDADEMLPLIETRGTANAAIPDAIKVREIAVPYVFQSHASGIHEQGRHEVLWYMKKFRGPKSHDHERDGERLLLRFGAVDYEAMVWIEDCLVATHRGGHVPFDVDVTGVLRNDDPEHEYMIRVRVFDSADDVTQPRGKQFWGPRPENIFYHPSSGIWQSVWLEVVPETRICDSSDGTILRSNDIEGGELHALIATTGRRVGQKYAIELEVKFAGIKVSCTPRQELPNTKCIRLDADMRLSHSQLQKLPAHITNAAPISDARCWLNGVPLWSPEHPHLYDLTIRLYSATGTLLDCIKTTTGMRSITYSHADGSLRLNNHPYFHALLLDQGYWPQTQMTSPSSLALRDDILASKALGFNGCRKHQKVEDPRFMYWADKLGFLVWGEMASAYRFTPDMTARFDEEWTAMVKRDINHPCIVAWTLANESWGYPDLKHDVQQRNHLRSLYHATKTLDPTRPVNGNCGWEHVITDLSTFHDYVDAAGMRERCASETSIFSRGAPVFLPSIDNAGASDPGSRHRPGAPILCTEFGGVNIASGARSGRDASHERGWGYTTASDGRDLVKRIEALCTAVVATGLVCGFVWTQLTDIEQETNGLLTFDRRPKLEVERVREVVENAGKTYLEMYEKRYGKRRHQGPFSARLDSIYVRGLKLERGRYLLAECAVGAQGEDGAREGEWLVSRLDLNACLTNCWGKLLWAKGGDFAASSKAVRLEEDGRVLVAEAGIGDGCWEASRVVLGERIRNVNGQLAFV